MRLKEHDHMVKAMQVVGDTVFNIPDSWHQTTTKQRSLWFFRRFFGLLFSLPVILVLAVVAGLASVLIVFSNYLVRWGDLISGPDKIPEPEPFNYQI